MRASDFNLLAVWFLIPETVATGWFSTAGEWALRLAGVEVQPDTPLCRAAGAVLLLLIVLAVRFRLGYLPVVGNPAGQGFRGGHQLLLGGNLLAALVFAFPFIFSLLPNPALMLLASVLAILFGCVALALWAIGFSLLHQSTQPSR